MFKVVRASEAMPRQIAETYKANNYITKDISPGVSLAVNEANDHQEMELTEYDRIYYVLEGEIELDFDGEHVRLQPSDSCFVAKDTEYKFSGTFKAVVVNQPAFGTVG
jgi:ethanolamine utilization protein EutQ (cupin superfamily)